jgi:hypothetical protein
LASSFPRRWAIILKPIVAIGEASGQTPSQAQIRGGKPAAKNGRADPCRFLIVENPVNATSCSLSF